jgi:hypothetical protein
VSLRFVVVLVWAGLAAAVLVYLPRPSIGGGDVSLDALLPLLPR